MALAVVADDHEVVVVVDPGRFIGNSLFCGPGGVEPGGEVGGEVPVAFVLDDEQAVGGHDLFAGWQGKV